jgi:hypothetical protein
MVYECMSVWCMSVLCMVYECTAVPFALSSGGKVLEYLGLGTPQAFEGGCVR